MPAEALNCAKCDTPLPVTAVSFSVSCSSCGQWHTIDRTGPEPVARPFADDAPAEPPPPNPDDPTAPVEEVKASEAIQRLDQDWQWERKKYLVLGLSGDSVVPDVWTGVIAALIGMAAGALIVYQAQKAGLTEQLAGLGVAAAGIGFGIYRVRQAVAYEDAHRRYQARRRASSKPRDPQ